MMAFASDFEQSIRSFDDEFVKLMKKKKFTTQTRIEFKEKFRDNIQLYLDIRT